jgi:hypothetical protein
MEAVECEKALQRKDSRYKGIVSRDPAVRRKSLKSLSFSMPCRPLLRFLYMYVLNFGFMDGLPGYHYCRLLAIYEYMIVIKMKEIRRQKSGLSM